MPAVIVGAPAPVILYDENEKAMAVQNGVAIPANTSGLILAGTDGANARYLGVDSSGKAAIQNPSNLDAALSTRLADATFTGRINTFGQKTMAASTPVVIPSDQILTVNIGLPAPVNPSLIYSTKLMNVGSPNLLVNGSVTPVVFSVSADPTNDIALTELRFVFSVSSFQFDGTMFGAKSTLTNGILISLRVNNGSVLNLDTIKVTEHLLEFGTETGMNIFTEFSTNTDVLVSVYCFGGAMRLKAGTTDYVKVTIRDDITHQQHKYFQATVHGRKL